VVALRVGQGNGGEGLALEADAWPEGCLGYSFNLVRPVVRGHRALLLYPMLNGSLVFESLETASQYRQICSQVATTLHRPRHERNVINALH